MNPRSEAGISHDSKKRPLLSLDKPAVISGWRKNIPVVSTDVACDDLGVENSDDPSVTGDSWLQRYMKRPEDFPNSSKTSTGSKPSGGEEDEHTNLACLALSKPSGGEEDEHINLACLALSLAQPNRGTNTTRTVILHHRSRWTVRRRLKCRRPIALRATSIRRTCYGVGNLKNGIRGAGDDDGEVPTPDGQVLAQDLSHTGIRILIKDSENGTEDGRSQDSSPQVQSAYPLPAMANTPKPRGIDFSIPSRSRAPIRAERKQEVRGEPPGPQVSYERITPHCPKVGDALSSRWDLGSCMNSHPTIDHLPSWGDRGAGDPLLPGEFQMSP
ncbi:hypothetical protein C8R47DRAFT_1082725 [Mycena vitilis]|nr:hypothetical protein C8R47DRAFT_1082725 [Mycena vitilis]